jgi:hypothetical protein
MNNDTGRERVKPSSPSGRNRFHPQSEVRFWAAMKSAAPHQILHNNNRREADPKRNKAKGLSPAHRAPEHQGTPWTAGELLLPGGRGSSER